MYESAYLYRILSTDIVSSKTMLGCSFSPSGACFTDRKLAAVRAYHEWMPIRQVDSDDRLRIWRNFQIGKLLLVVLKAMSEVKLILEFQ